MANGSASNLFNPTLKSMFDLLNQKHRVFLSYYHNDDEY